MYNSMNTSPRNEFSLGQQEKETANSQTRNLLTLDQQAKADDTQLLLIDGYPVRINVISGIPFVCKVHLEGKQPPLTFQLRNKTQDGLQVYGSYFNKMPNSTESDLSQLNPDNITVPGVS